MEAFGKALNAMRSRPWQVLGLSLMFAIGSFALFLGVGFLVTLLGWGEIASMHTQFQADRMMGSLILQAMSKLAVAILIGVAAYIAGNAYLTAGLYGTAGTVFSEGQLHVSVASFFRFAGRYFGRVLVLNLLFSLGSGAYWLLVGLIAWTIHGVAILMGLWLFIAFVIYVLLFPPVISLGYAAAILENQGGTAALGTGINTVRKTPLPTMGAAFLLGVLWVLVAGIGGPILISMHLLGNLILSLISAVMGLYGQLVWFFFFKAPQHPGVSGNPDLSI